MKLTTEQALTFYKNYSVSELISNNNFDLTHLRNKEVFLSYSKVIIDNNELKFIKIFGDKALLNDFTKIKEVNTSNFFKEIKDYPNVDIGEIQVCLKQDYAKFLTNDTFCQQYTKISTKLDRQFSTENTSMLVDMKRDNLKI